MVISAACFRVGGATNASRWLSPISNPSTTPMKRPLPSTPKTPVTSVPFSATRTSAVATSGGTTTWTSTLLAEIRSARFERTLIASSSAAAGAMPAATSTIASSPVPRPRVLRRHAGGFVFFVIAGSFLRDRSVTRATPDRVSAIRERVRVVALAAADRPAHADLQLVGLVRRVHRQIHLAGAARRQRLEARDDRPVQQERTPDREIGRRAVVRDHPAGV